MRTLFADFLRFPLLLLLIAAIAGGAGCAGKRPSRAGRGASVQNDGRAVPRKVADPIDALVARLTATGGLWVNGVVPIVEAPATASTEQVLERVFKMTGFDRGHVTTFQVIETRPVRIPATGSADTFTAVLVDTNLGRKIVLLRSSASSSFWWSRVYDA